MHPRARGVTLLELMITVAIVAILAAIAYPSYRNQIVRSNRTEARNALIQAAAALERCYTHNRTYVACAGLTVGATPSGYYNVTLQSATATQFSLRADPVGAQANDGDCGRFTMSEVGRAAVRSDLTTDSTAICWR